MRTQLLFALAVFAPRGLLLGCAALEADQIHARDLAAVVSEFSSVDPETIVAPAPVAGVTRVMRSGELLSLAKRFRLSLPAVLSEICFERAAEPLTEVHLQPVLEQSLGVSDVEILDFSHLRIPHNAVLEFPRSSLLSSGYWRGRVVYDGNRVVPVWVKIKPLTAGPAMVNGGDKADHFDKTRGDKTGGDAVDRGDRVEVEVQSGPARLSFEAHAETTGRAGDSILVRNPENGRLFQARVVGKGKVLVQR